MASFPPQQPQRRSPNRQQSSSEQSHSFHRPESEAPSSTSIDSQTVLLDGPASSKTKSAAEESASATPQPEQHPPTSDEDPERCWICFGEPSEDKEPRTWRHPCKCNLPAHESCLLDWIADIESPDSNQSAAKRADIHCPNCQSEIRLARPRSFAVDLYGLLEHFERKALLPATVTGLGYMVLLAFSHHGAHTIRTVFGDRDASIILRPRAYASWNWFERQTAFYFPNAARPFWREWRGLRVELGLPLIPLALIASRTRLGDAALPFLPIAFFATHPVSSETLHIGYWPPSAALSLVMLPYVRSVYNEGMERFWGERERGWAKEVKPNLNGVDDGDDGEEAPVDADDANNVDEVLQLEIELNMGDDDEEQVQQEAGELLNDDAAQPPPDIAYAADAEVEGDNHGDPETELQAELRELEQQQARFRQLHGEAEQRLDQIQQQQQQQNRRNNGQRHEFERHFDLIKSANSIAETVFGALLFPTVSSVSGEVLRLVLPASWVTLPRSRGPSGLLQTKWGRSIVGGCLFVVLKDAFRIYCKWRAAVSFRERRVRDYDRKKGVYL